MDESSIRSFFKNKTILITGATGFVGRFLIYKILNNLGVKRIYILLRPKKNKGVPQRLHEYKSLELFSYLHDASLLDKVVAVDGDVCFPNLKLSRGDLKRVAEEVSIVYHSAATIRFTEPLKTASKLHILGTDHVVQVCKAMRNFQILVHVSSIASWSIHESLEEWIPDAPLDPLSFASKIEAMNDNDVDKIEKQMIGRFEENKWLNTYSLTKSLAENVVDSSDLSKIAVVRPPFLMSPMRDPQIGWFDEPQSGAGLTAMYSMGILRIAHLNVNTEIELIPIDMCVNALISIAWYQFGRNDKRIDVYNMSSSEAFPMQGREVLQEGISLGYQYPSLKQIRPPIDMYHISPSKSYVRLKDFFTHTLFCLLVDLVLILSGRKAFMYSLTRKNANAISHIFETTSNYKKKFVVRTGKLNHVYDSSVGREEKEIFFYDTKSIPWKRLALENHLRFRRHVLREPDSSLDYARRRLKVISVVYNMFKVLSWLALALLAHRVHVLLFPMPPLWLLFLALVSYSLAVFMIQ